jgi:hypothetical protein
MLDNMNTLSFRMAIERFLAVRPRPAVLLADNRTNFHGGEASLQEKEKIDMSEAHKKLNIQFQFAPPKAPHFQRLVEKVVGAAKQAMKPTLQSRVVTGEELRTVFAKTMGILNNIPISYVTKSDMDFHYSPLTANHFLLGQPYSELVGSETGSLSAVKKFKKLTEILQVFWAKLVAKLSTHLRQYNTWITETRGVKLGDIALLLNLKKRGMMPLVWVSEVQRGLDAQIRRVTVFDGHSHFLRAITSLAVLVPAEEENVNKPVETSQ